MSKLSAGHSWDWHSISIKIGSNRNFNHIKCSLCKETMLWSIILKKDFLGHCHVSSNFNNLFQSPLLVYGKEFLAALKDKTSNKNARMNRATAETQIKTECFQVFLIIIAFNLHVYRSLCRSICLFIYTLFNRKYCWKNKIK